MKAHNYMTVPTPDKPAVAQICLKLSTKLHCYQRVFPGDKKLWQICPASLITNILKHFFLNDKDSLFTLAENKLAHVSCEKLWS